MSRLKYLAVLLLGVAITLLCVFCYHTATKPKDNESAFQHNVDYVLAHPVAHPRTIRAPETEPIVLLNWGYHGDYVSSGGYPIGAIAKGQELTEFGTLSNGDVLMCYTYDGLHPEKACSNGAAFAMNPGDFKDALK